MGWGSYLQVVGTCNHYLLSSNFFDSEVVGSLKPSITCPLLSLAPRGSRGQGLTPLTPRGSRGWGLTPRGSRGQGLTPPHSQGIQRMRPSPSPLGGPGREASLPLAPQGPGGDASLPLAPRGPGSDASLPPRPQGVQGASHLVKLSLPDFLYLFIY